MELLYVFRPIIYTCCCCWFIVKHPISIISQSNHIEKKATKITLEKGVESWEKTTFRVYVLHYMKCFCIVWLAVITILASIPLPRKYFLPFRFALWGMWNACNGYAILFNLLNIRNKRMPLLMKSQTTQIKSLNVIATKSVFITLSVSLPLC